MYLIYLSLLKIVGRRGLSLNNIYIYTYISVINVKKSVIFTQIVDDLKQLCVFFLGFFFYKFMILVVMTLIEKLTGWVILLCALSTFPVFGVFIAWLVVIW